MREELLEDGENPNDIDILQKMFGDHILPSDHPHNALAVNIMERVLSANDWCRDMAAGDIKWKIVVVDDNDGIVNALSLPSGDIAVYKGMIDACDNLDELGLIISHEMAHVIMNHGVESISLSSLLSFFSLFVIGFIWFFVPSDILSFILHKFFHNSIEQMTHFRYSRKLELEADQVGLLLASKACFLPVNAIKVWKHLPMFNESNKLQEYFESHPCNERRFFNLEMTLPHADKIYSTTNCETTMKSEMSSFKGIAKKLLTKIITG
jgi:Zn-dependent protease with chaperone function